MNAMIVVIVSAVVLACAYILYGGWLARQWGVDPNRETPAHEFEDGVDYVPSPSYVVFGHHVSSILGAGSIGGAIQAAVFGWVPVVLWIAVGGIFFGAVQDFGSLLASLRHKGATLAEVVGRNVDDTAKRLFCLFAFVSIVLLVAALASIVAGTFQVVDSQTADVNERNSRVAMISILFAVVAIIWGAIMRGRRVHPALNIACAIVLVCAIVAAGFNMPAVIALDHTSWMLVLGAYVLVTAIAPVWTILQPRDYLSSFLLYGVLLLAMIGTIGAGVVGTATDLQIPAFTGFVASSTAFDATTGATVVQDGVTVVNQSAQGGFLFPALFVTVGCGAISGFHGIVASGTTSKQVESEAHAKPIGFGGMLVECMLAIVAVCAVGFVWTNFTAGGYASPAQVFADGLSSMLATIPGVEGYKDLAYALIALAVSAFCLTTLDTATRLGRILLQELWIPAGQTPDDVSGLRKALGNRYVSTIVTVALGIGLGMAGYSLVWPLFGTANLLLAFLALLAIGAWLGNAGKNNRMLLVPMAFILAVTLASLVLIVMQGIASIIVGGDIAAPLVQLVIALALLVLSIAQARKGFRIAFGRRAR